MAAVLSTELVPVDELFTYAERLALVGFLAAYRGATRDAYASDLRQFSTWCTDHRTHLFEAVANVWAARVGSGEAA